MSESPVVWIGPARPSHEQPWERTSLDADSAEKSASSVLDADSAEKSASSVLDADSAEKSASSVLDGDAHRTGRARDGLLGRFDRRGVEVGHLLLRDLPKLGAGNRTHLRALRGT